MENSPDQSKFYLYLATLPTDHSQLIGAPVFFESRLVGIVVGGPSRSVSGAFIVGALSVRGMALSKVTSAVRVLLPWINDEPGISPSAIPERGSGERTTSPVFAQNANARAPAEAAGTATAEESKDETGAASAPVSATLAATPNKESEPAPSDLSDADLFDRLSPSARRVFERAMGMLSQARVRSRDKLHMEFLIAGLFDSWRAFFAAANVDGAELRRVIKGTAGTQIPLDYQTVPLDKLPEMSKHVREAVLEAVKYARERKSPKIWRTDLLYGALSVSDCRMIKALYDLGLHKEKIRPDEAADEERSEAIEELPGAEAPNASVAEQGAELKFPGYADLPATAANPTPKVASDLWCEADRLGYEAYARTIASLITHKETVAPLTIGIKAPWGVGKTSLMKRVQHLLDGYAELSERSRIGILQEGQLPKVTLGELLEELKGSSKPTKLEAKRSKEGESYGLPPRTTVWFNAWKYQTSEQIWAGMAHCIISQVTARMDVKERELFWLRLHARRINVAEVRHKIYEMVTRQMVPLALLVLAGCAIAFWIAAVAPMGVPWRYVIRGVSVLLGAYSMRKEWGSKLGEKAAGTVRELIREPDYEGKMGYLHLVESDIREVLQLATEASMTKEKPNGDPLVVFVDDLDRCAPNKVAEVVEAINLFLCGDYPNCVFVLAMEPGMVAAALEVANKDVIEKAQEMGFTDPAVPVGWRFMEKIVQLPITIPPPTKGGRKSYVESLTGFREWNAAFAQILENGLDAPDRGLGIGLAAVSRIKEMATQQGAEPKPLDETEVKQYMGELEGRSLGEVEAKSAKALAEAAPEKRRAAAEASKRMYAQTFSERDPAMAEFVNEVADLVDGNPRQIKRYVNVFRFYSTLRHSLRVDGTVAADELPSDRVLAKFVALSIQWPHAVDCLRVRKDAKAGTANGHKVTVLELLESESRKPATDIAATDEAWEKYVGKDGLGLGTWAAKRTFREFMARGESLCQKEGHGLW